MKIASLMNKSRERERERERERKGNFWNRMNMITRTISRLNGARVVYIAWYAVFVGNHQ